MSVSITISLVPKSIIFIFPFEPKMQKRFWFFVGKWLEMEFVLFLFNIYLFYQRPYWMVSNLDEQ